MHKAATAVGLIPIAVAFVMSILHIAADKPAYGHVMARVECDIEETLIEHKGRSTTGICVMCSYCEHTIELPGRDTPENRLAAKKAFQTTCPERMHNSYVFPEAAREDPQQSNE